jgi:hypothetical protein
MNVEAAPVDDEAMTTVERGSIEEFFRDRLLGRQVYEAVAGFVDELGPATVRVTRSQVAFRRATGFCWVWLPGLYLRNPAAEVVVSVALEREDESDRWKQVVQVANRRWMHHLEVADPSELDAMFAALLAEAYEAAG